MTHCSKKYTQINLLLSSIVIIIIIISTINAILEEKEKAVGVDTLIEQCQHVYIHFIFIITTHPQSRPLLDSNIHPEQRIT